MFIDTGHQIQGMPLIVVVRAKTEERLKGTCFRFRDKVNLAGNFFLWSNPSELFREETVATRFLEDIKKAFEEKSQTNSFDMDFGSPVGWSGTDDITQYREEDMESFKPNHKSWAMRIKINRVDLLAPQTNYLTIIYELKAEGQNLVAIVHSMYPGRDIGELDGNISQRELCVFFDWNHPGAPL